MIVIDGGANSYSYNSCYQYANANGYIYFALQNGTGPSNAKCCVSNNIVQLVQYGTNADGAGRGTVTSLTSSVDGKVYGGGWANAVYMVSSTNWHY